MDKIILLQKIVDKKITQSDVAEQLNLSERHIRRLVACYKEHGSQIFARKNNIKSNRRLDDGLKIKTLEIIKRQYYDFGPTLISEKLSELDAINISKETIRKWLIEDGLWKGKRRKPYKIHQSRERRECFGELVQIDGSPHDWFEGRGGKCCLIVMIDDATSRIVSSRFEESETTFGYMKAAKTHIKKYGRPIAYYSDKHSIFKTSRESAKDGILQDTQFHRALKELGITLICANSPQAKGRVERANQTLQDRLIKEMRLKNISTIDAANIYLPEFIELYNRKFGVEPVKKENAHRALTLSDDELDLVLSYQEQRKISKNLEFSLDGNKYQIIEAGKGYRMRQGTLQIYRSCEGNLRVQYEGKDLKYKIMHHYAGPIIADSKELVAILDKLICVSYPQNPHPHQHAQN